MGLLPRHWLCHLRLLAPVWGGLATSAPPSDGEWCWEGNPPSPSQLRPLTIATRPPGEHRAGSSRRQLPPPLAPMSSSGFGNFQSSQECSLKCSRPRECKEQAGALRPPSPGRKQSAITQAGRLHQAQEMDAAFWNLYHPKGKCLLNHRSQERLGGRGGECRDLARIPAQEGPAEGAWHQPPISSPVSVATVPSPGETQTKERQPEGLGHPLGCTHVQAHPRAHAKYTGTHTGAHTESISDAAEIRPFILPLGLTPAYLPTWTTAGV